METWQVGRVQQEAAQIMSEKGSYDVVSIDPRILKEYERAYKFIQELADGR